MKLILGAEAALYFVERCSQRGKMSRVRGHAPVCVGEVDETPLVSRHSPVEVMLVAQAVLAGCRAGGWGQLAHNTCLYAAALAAMDDSDPLLWENMEAVARFQQSMDGWEGASATCRRMVQVGAANAEQEDGRKVMNVLAHLNTVFRHGGGGWRRQRSCQHALWGL